MYQRLKIRKCQLPAPVSVCSVKNQDADALLQNYTIVKKRQGLNAVNIHIQKEKVCEPSSEDQIAAGNIEQCL